MTIWGRTWAQRELVARGLGSAVLRLRPDGLQARARRNAWSAMVADHQRRLDRVHPSHRQHQRALQRPLVLADQG